MLSGRSVTVGVATPKAFGAPARCAVLAVLAGVALAGCVGDTDDLFPAISLAPPGDVPGVIEAPGGTVEDDAVTEDAVTDDGATPAPGLPASGEAVAPPVTLDTDTAETSGNGAASPSPAPGDAPIEATPAPDEPAEPEPSTPASDTGSEAVAEVAQLCANITDPLLLDFASPGDDPTQALFGDFERLLSGGTYVYPTTASAEPATSDDPGLVSDVTDGDWHIMGSVAQQSGFGLFLDCQLLDASRFAGIAFRVSGNMGGADTLTLLVGTADNDVSRAWRLANEGASPPSSGRCTPEADEYDGTCNTARVDIPVARQSREIVVPFSALAGGSPEPGVNPAEITTIAWALPSPSVNRRGDVQPYAVDLRIDDIRFVEATAP